MAEGRTIQDAVKTLADMWKEQDKKVCAEEIRQWVQPHVPHIFELLSQKDVAGLLEKISADAFPEGSWQSAVALNQILFLAQTARPEGAEEVLKKFYEVWNKQPLNLSALLVEWRKATTKSKLSPEIILETINYDPSKQSYFDPDISGDGAEFFMNMYKNEFDLDVDALSDRVAGVVGNGLLREFFRLVDVDRPMEPEEFVGRVEKALDILNTAKEQGLDVKAVFKKWDELADAGGERLEKLPLAVKAVAEEAVRERFWKAMLDRAKKLKLPVIESKVNVAELLATMHALGFVKIGDKNVEFEKDVDEILSHTLEILLKANPSALYTTSDIAEMMLMILKESKDRKTAVAAAEVMAALDVPTLKKILDAGMVGHLVAVVEKTLLQGLVKKEELVEALRETVAENGGERDGFMHSIMNRLHKIKER